MGCWKWKGAQRPSGPNCLILQMGRPRWAELKLTVSGWLVGLMAKLGLEPRCPEVLQGPVQCDPSIPQHTVLTCYMCGQVELSSDLAPSCLLLHSPGRGGISGQRGEGTDTLLAETPHSCWGPRPWPQKGVLVQVW